MHHAIVSDVHPHHLHLRASDPEAAATWYAAHLGLQAGGEGPLRYAHSATEHSATEQPANGRFVWYSADAPVPPSHGSALDHYGWSVPSVDDAHQALVAAGCRSAVEPRTIEAARLRLSFLDDPWGCRLELLEDPELLGLHHVHLLSTAPESDREWWHRHFGGKPEQFRDLVPGLRFERFWILFRASETELEPTTGRAADHLALMVPDVDAAVTALADQGVEILAAPRDQGNLRIAFCRSPRGVGVELLARRD